VFVNKRDVTSYEIKYDRAHLITKFIFVFVLDLALVVYNWAHQEPIQECKQNCLYLYYG